MNSFTTCLNKKSNAPMDNRAPPRRRCSTMHGIFEDALCVHYKRKRKNTYEKENGSHQERPSATASLDAAVYILSLRRKGAVTRAGDDFLPCIRSQGSISHRHSTFTLFCFLQRSHVTLAPTFVSLFFSLFLLQSCAFSLPSSSACPDLQKRQHQHSSSQGRWAVAIRSPSDGRRFDLLSYF